MGGNRGKVCGGSEKERTMKPGGGKQKGGEFERQICKKLSLWVSDGKSDDLFWRSAMSGGRVTVRTKKGTKTASGHGDITAVVPKGNELTDRFVIECKNYKLLGFYQHIYGKGPLAGIWAKLKEVCYFTEKIPMLIMKENNKPILIGLNFLFGSRICLCSFWSDLHLYYFEDITTILFKEFKIPE